jgi:hypothetical protein
MAELRDLMHRLTLSDLNPRSSDDLCGAGVWEAQPDANTAGGNADSPPPIEPSALLHPC